jgi:hypothetical protein
MKRTLALAGLMLASAGVVIASPASADVHTMTCNLDQIVQSRAADLGVHAEVGAMREDGWGTAMADGIIVSRETPCERDLVVSIVNHEFMHVIQYSMPNWDEKYAGRFEIVADCASKLIGSTRTPYVDGKGCSSKNLMLAKELVNHVELPAHVAM